VRSESFRIGQVGGDLTGEAPPPFHTHQARRSQGAGRASYVLKAAPGRARASRTSCRVDKYLRNGSGRGVQAIVVYPRTPWRTSQREALKKFLERGIPAGTQVRFARLIRGGEGGREGGDSEQPPTSSSHELCDVGADGSRGATIGELVLRGSACDHRRREVEHISRPSGTDIHFSIRRCRVCVRQTTTFCMARGDEGGGGPSKSRRGAGAHVAQTLFGVRAISRRSSPRAGTRYARGRCDGRSERGDRCAQESCGQCRGRVRRLQRPIHCVGIRVHVRRPHEGESKRPVRQGPASPVGEEGAAGVVE